MTTAAWSANLDAHWDEAVAEVGLGKARVWRLYLAGVRARLRAEQDPAAPGARRVVHDDGRSGLPLRPDWV